MRVREDESGQMLVLTALSLTILLGFVALAVDVGVMFRAQRNMQIAADAAAVAAALNANYSTVSGSSPTSAADAAAALNGVASQYVTVNTYPNIAYGWHTGLGYYEVLVSTPNPTIFMNVFGLHSINVAARAVAGIVPSPSCIYVLDQTDPATLDVQGDALINTPNCGIEVASSSPGAICTTGGKATINAPIIRTPGGQTGSGKCNGYQSNVLQSGSLSVTDPLNNFLGSPTDPPCSGSPDTSTFTLTGTVAGPGFGNSVCYMNAISISNANLGPGTYVFENGVTLNGTVNVGIPSAPNTTTTNGATLDVENGGFWQGNAALSIYAPQNKATPYNGIALMVPSTNLVPTCDPSIQQPAPCLQVQFGSGYGNLTGLIYAPAATVYMQDNGGGTVVTGIISYKVYDKSSTLSVTDSYNSQNPSTTPLSTVAMVE
ncbi:MAG: pilus assembly protein TadG-related protein [Terriglobia bacterium]|nr:pilus assembly protein TadG-related protein [Terriglobia bacterium]